ncbi:hypothetical protein AVEN_159726-1 [Araneus ventricosus]|uniref:Uncharacterized protein n=1 Tax=Araneus ventricosus TaxID=182803 RepID=A0A4Y2JUZ8_ARAVE|nr:hypothetical protein AVEN_159726-1 [Araneus ventricosus]
MKAPPGPASNSPNFYVTPAGGRLILDGFGECQDIINCISVLVSGLPISERQNTAARSWRSEVGGSGVTWMKKERTGVDGASFYLFFSVAHGQRVVINSTPESFA